ncbi:protein kinase [Arthrobacter sp. zg-Y1143]|uniref:protein kinase domain-containing protein n=1 Tax=Arthrobacter sp. zg-Y1143 TaxID=3049065 RepID=UPI0024C30EBA|nr:protein kinase [Arthrobacter sp. zg-Y1143]MDK1327408.1 protein kinase [Arthrobacter sp. zg-Y1143]
MDTTPNDGRPGVPPHETFSPEAGTDAPGRTAPAVRGFSVDRLLGTGGSGAVWLVRDAAGSAFALKVPAGAGHHGFEARREVNVLARMEHPHLVQLHGVAETDQGEGLLVGYAAGGSAAALVAARGPVQPGEAVSVLVGIAGALGYLHARGAAHGDVSPANILFTAEGKPQLADFGQARLLGEPGTSAPATPGFDAPEVGGSRQRQRSRQSTLGAAADVYALAAVGWFLLTGKPPPPVRDRPPLSILVPGVGRELPALLEAGLSEDPDVRPGADEMAAWAYRGARPLPVDLVASAHPEVRPDLLTRRTGSAARAGGTKKGRGRRPQKEPNREGERNRGRGRISGRGTRQFRRPLPPHRRRPAGTFVRVAAIVLVAAVLLLAGVALAAPDLLRAETNRSAGPAKDAPVEPRPDGGSGEGAETRTEDVGHGNPDGASGDDTGDGAAGQGRGESQGMQGEQTPAVEVLLATAAAADPAEAVPALAELRARAFRTGDPRLLAHVDAPESPALSADEEQVGRLARDGQALRGLEMQASVLAPDTPAAGGSAAPAEVTVQLRVRLEVSAYQRVGRDGLVLEDASARQQEVVLVLVQSGGTWKISTVFGTD